MNYSEAEMGNAVTAHVNISMVFTIDVTGMTREEMTQVMTEQSGFLATLMTDAGATAMPDADVRAVTPKLAHSLVFDGEGRLIRMMDVTTGADL